MSRKVYLFVARTASREDDTGLSMAAIVLSPVLERSGVFPGPIVGHQSGVRRLLFGCHSSDGANLLFDLVRRSSREAKLSSIEWKCIAHTDEARLAAVYPRIIECERRSAYVHSESGSLWFRIISRQSAAQKGMEEKMSRRKGMKNRIYTHMLSASASTSFIRRDRVLVLRRPCVCVVRSIARSVAPLSGVHGDADGPHNDVGSSWLILEHWIQSS